jgi:hypothetical protein
MKFVELFTPLKMRAVVILLALALAFGSAPAPIPERLSSIRQMADEEVLDTIEGLLEGLAFGFHVGDIVNCLGDVKNTGYDLYEAVIHFEKKDLVDTAEALKDIANAFSSVSAAIGPCTNAYKNDTEILEQELAVFRSPMSLVYDVGHNLVVNHVQIYNETETAVADYKAEKWNGFGYNIGLALGKVFADDEHSRLAFEINRHPAATWEATAYKKFHGKSTEELQVYTGTILGDKTDKPKSFLDYTQEDVKALPTSFDARTKWPDCIHAIRNQEQCGSCWAFSTSEALSDRFCIASNGEINEVFSP